MISAQVFGLLIFTLIIKVSADPIPITVSKSDNKSMNLTQVEFGQLNNTLSTNQTGRQEDLAFVATGSEVADSAIKITGFVFKFLSQTVQSIFGKKGVYGAVQAVIDPTGAATAQGQDKKQTGQTPKCIPQKYNLRNRPKIQQPLRSGVTEAGHIPAKAIIYNLISNHEYIAQLFKNPDDEKLLGVVAIVSRNRIIPLVVNAVDLKLLKVETSNQSFDLEFADDNLENPETQRQESIVDSVDEVTIDSPVAETTLEVTKYIFGYLTQTVSSVFGTTESATSTQKNSSTSEYNKKPNSCISITQMLHSKLEDIENQDSENTNTTSIEEFETQDFENVNTTSIEKIEIQDSENSNTTRIPGQGRRHDYFNKVFNITNDEEQKILGIVAIVSKNGVTPLLVKAVDLESIEENPLSNVFRNWDQILDVAGKNNSDSGPKNNEEIEIVKHIQALRKVHPWLLPKVF